MVPLRRPMGYLRPKCFKQVFDIKLFSMFIVFYDNSFLKKHMLDMLYISYFFS